MPDLLLSIEGGKLGSRDISDVIADSVMLVEIL